MSTHRKASLTEKMKIHEFLSKVLVPTESLDEKGRVVYRYSEDWHDDKVAKAIDPTLNRGPVQNVRLEMFGPVKGPKRPKPVSVPVGKHEALETRVANLERFVHYLCKQFDIPCDPNTGT